MPYIGVLDESNLTPGAFVKFYVTAVLACPVESLRALSSEVAAVRQLHGYGPGDFLKWESHSRPEGVGAANHLAAKNDILRLLPRHGLVFLPVLVHHHVAENKPRKTLVEWSANMAILIWERFLEGAGDDGVCILDRRPDGDEAGYLRGVFGRTADPVTKQDFSLKRTHLLAYTMEGASHLLSVLDVALGAFCYSINERRPEKSKIASALHIGVVGAMRTISLPTGEKILDKEGYAFLPLRKKSPQVQADYSELVEHWNRLLSTQPG